MHSKFMSFQKLTIQETSEDTPMGTIPRQFTVYLYGKKVRSCTPGDLITLDAIQLVEKMKRGHYQGDNMVLNTYLEAVKIELEKKNFSSLKIDENFQR